MRLLRPAFQGRARLEVAGVSAAEIQKEADSMGPARGAWMARHLAELLIAGAGVLVYLDSFQGAFVYDEINFITNNPTIRRLWPLWPTMLAPINVNRPLIGLSNAINYSISGLNPWSYHALNLLIHIVATLALFGIVRRTLVTDTLAERFGKNSTGLALAVALIWMVHPLQTQSVTYIVQRGESLMGLFFLVTLYCSIRGFYSTRSKVWYASAIAVCALGMLSKQVMVAAPVMVLLYDVIFVAGRTTTAIRRRWQLYAGLAGTWGVLAATMLAAPSYQTAGFAMQSISSWEYFKSEFGVILHYLRLALWPGPLCLDYGWPQARTAGEIIPAAILIGGLELTTIWAIVRRKPLGYVGAWFFVIISVTSSFVPIADLAFEHRMYLPLASVVALVVLGGYSVGDWLLNRSKMVARRDPQAGRRVALGAVTAIVVALGFLTVRRNIDYMSPIVMWSDVVRKRPDNVRGHNNLGLLFDGRGELEAAVAQFSEALRLDPGFSEAHS